MEKEQLAIGLCAAHIITAVAIAFWQHADAESLLKALEAIREVTSRLPIPKSF